MNRCVISCLVIAAAPFTACQRDEPPSQTSVCSEAWYRMIDEKVQTGDGQGHGPDLGSDEWKSAVEFKLGIRGDPDLPRRDTEAWCRHIDRLVRSSRGASGQSADPGRVSGTGPSFSWGEVAPGSPHVTAATG